MASTRQEFAIAAAPEEVWEALRDFGALHERLVPGFVVDARLDGDARIITFANGAVARELLVDIDDGRRRLVYSVVESPLGSTHHNASAQVFEDGQGGTRFEWITDVLPHELATATQGLMEQGARVMKETLESAVAVDTHTALVGGEAASG